MEPGLTGPMSCQSLTVSMLLKRPPSTVNCNCNCFCSDNHILSIVWEGMDRQTRIYIGRQYCRGCLGVRRCVHRCPGGSSHPPAPLPLEGGRGATRWAGWSRPGWSALRWPAGRTVVPEPALLQHPGNITHCPWWPGGPS